MKIERIPDDVLVLRVHLAEATMPDGKKIDISLAGSDLIVELDHKFYSVGMESIVKDVIKFSKEE
ncbi:MAG: hypothetical protein J7J52_01220 [Deltaproteobacteria bacterium]|nr:hypothetical protein [Deltaproteobacteria bacterium]